jgi:small subunit ribosomal protein S3
MTHVVHPYAHRIGILRDWRSRWFRSGKEYRKILREDVLLRAFLEKHLKGLSVASVEIERGGKETKIILKTARPGMLIGRQGEGTQRIKVAIAKFLSKNKIEMKEFRLEVEEVRFPESNAAVVAEMMREGLERRFPFRRVLKQTMDKVMANKEVKGARFAVSGRLGGAEMSRKEEIKKGMLPLQTLRADVEFARARAVLPYGSIGVKVWIYKGEKFEQDSK